MTEGVRPLSSGKFFFALPYDVAEHGKANQRRSVWNHLDEFYGDTRQLQLVSDRLRDSEQQRHGEAAYRGIRAHFACGKGDEAAPRLHILCERIHVAAGQEVAAASAQNPAQNQRDILDTYRLDTDGFGGVLVFADGTDLQAQRRLVQKQVHDRDHNQGKDSHNVDAADRGRGDRRERGRASVAGECQQ